MSESMKKDIAKLIRDPEGVTRALQKAVRLAMLQHKRAGDPVVAWRDGQVVWIPAEEIDVSEEDESKPPAE